MENEPKNLPPVPPIEAYDEDYIDPWTVQKENLDKIVQSAPPKVSRPLGESVNRLPKVDEFLASEASKIEEGIKLVEGIKDDLNNGVDLVYPDDHLTHMIKCVEHECFANGEFDENCEEAIIEPVHPLVEPPKDLEWYLERMNDQQRSAFDDMCNGKNVFLTGEGGTGKSFVTEAFVLWLKKVRSKYILCAPTGAAAINVGGITMHRAFCLGIDYVENSYQSFTNEKVRDVIQCADVIVIDEIGMVRADNLCHVEYKCRKFHPPAQPVEEIWGDKQVVVVGDFFQFKPIVQAKNRTDELALIKSLNDNYGGVYAFESHAWKAANFTSHVLMVSERHKNGDNAAEFMRNMNLARVGDPDCIRYFNEHCGNKLTPDQDDTVISFTNAAADAVNRLRLDRVEGQEWSIDEIVNGTVNEGDKIAQPTLQLRVGAKVTMLVNNYEDGYVNGTMAIVERIDVSAFPSKDDVIVCRELKTNKLIDVHRHHWDVEELETVNGKPEKVQIGWIKQFPLRLAWAITANKSQGKTLDSAIILLDGKWRTHGGLYVALSRVKTLEGITLKKLIAERDLVCDFKVLHFYAQLTGEDMKCTYPARLHTLIAGLLELEALAPPDGCYRWINERITYSIAEMNERNLK